MRDLHGQVAIFGRRERQNAVMWLLGYGLPQRAARRCARPQVNL